MLGDLPAYEARAATGHPALTDAPAHWRVAPMRSLIRPRSERNRADLPLLTVARERGVFVRHEDDGNHNVIPEDLSNYKFARQGDLVINKMKAWQGSLGLAPVDGIVSPAYFVFDFSIDNRAFGQYLLRSKPYVGLMAAASDGVRIGQWDLVTDRFRALPVLIPPTEEQAAIVTYLGHAHARIDRVIAAKRDLIALLGEQKRAVAHEVLRESDGGSRALKHVLRQLIDCEHKTAPRAEGDYWILRTSAIRAGDINWNGAYTTDAASYGEWTSRGKPEAGDVIFTREAPVGEAAVIPEGRHTALGQRTVLMKLRRDLMDPSFLVHQIYSGVPRDRITLATQGSTVGHFNMDDIGWMRVVVPPLAAQREMVARVSAVTSASDEAIARARSEIELLREFRTRLTADIVTGQVDVRSAAATLPPLDPHDVPLDVENGDEDEADDALDPVEDA